MGMGTSITGWYRPRTGNNRNRARVVLNRVIKSGHNRVRVSQGQEQNQWAQATGPGQRPAFKCNRSWSARVRSGGLSTVELSTWSGQGQVRSGSSIRARKCKPRHSKTGSNREGRAQGPAQV
jgi:hypothetical protein